MCFRLWRGVLFISFVLCFIYNMPLWGADYSWLAIENLPKPLQAPLKLLGTTAMSGLGRDYYSLPPGKAAVIGTIAGPAIIFRIWSTSSDMAQTSLDMIVDGKRVPLYVHGCLPRNIAPDDPLLGMDKQAYWSYAPVIVKKQVLFKAQNHQKTAPEPMRFYLQVGYRAVSSAELQEAAQWNLKAIRKRLQKLKEPRDIFSDLPIIELEVPAGQTVPVPVTGPAMILNMDISPAGDSAAEAAWPAGEQLRQLRLQILCDGVKTVDVPLFGLVGHSLQPRATTGMAVNKEAHIILRFPMPIAQSMSLGFVSKGVSSVKALRVRLHSQPLPNSPRYRFCAQFFSQISVQDQPMTLLNVTGEGLFVGTHLSVNGQERKTFAFLEGNEQIYIDGEAKPTLEGTGTEDYFNGAWYFEAGERTHLFHGVTFKQEREPPIVDCYRYLISDCIPFKKSFRFDWQHGSRNKAAGVLYEGVMFWYQAPPIVVAEPVLASAGSAGPPTKAPSNMAAASPYAIRLIGFLAALGIVAFLSWALLLRRKT